MKKILGMLFIVIGISTVAYAQETPPFSLSVGGGPYFSAGIPMWDNVEGTLLEVGGFGFFDFTYAEIDAGIAYYKQTKAEVYGTTLNFAFLLKYPFDFERFAIFPLFGAGFSIPLTQLHDGKAVGGFAIKDHVRFGLQGGVGMDFPLSGGLYLRTSILCDINFSAPGKNPGDDILYTIGPRVKAAAGYKF
jgi:hypothetical protein